MFNINVQLLLDKLDQEEVEAHLKEKILKQNLQFKNTDH